MAWIVGRRASRCYGSSLFELSNGLPIRADISQVRNIVTDSYNSNSTSLCVFKIEFRL